MIVSLIVQGVNRGFAQLLKEYSDKWLFEAVTPLGSVLLVAVRLANHMDNVKDLLSNYIGRNNDGDMKAFV